MIIRKALISDFKTMYRIGCQTPEMQVNYNDPFMERDDFRSRILDKTNVFLVAEEDDKIIGFICANASDKDRPLKDEWACLVYIVVIPEFRKHGIATLLYNECTKTLKKRGITHLYALADGNTQAIQNFLKKAGFRTGKKIVWMDRKL